MASGQSTGDHLANIFSELSATRRNVSEVDRSVKSLEEKLDRLCNQLEAKSAKGHKSKSSLTTAQAKLWLALSADVRFSAEDVQKQFNDQIASGAMVAFPSCSDKHYKLERDARLAKIKESANYKSLAADNVLTEDFLTSWFDKKFNFRGCSAAKKRRYLLDESAATDESSDKSFEVTSQLSEQLKAELKAAAEKEAKEANLARNYISEVRSVPLSTIKSAYLDDQLAQLGIKKAKSKTVAKKAIQLADLLAKQDGQAYDWRAGTGAAPVASREPPSVSDIEAGVVA